MSVNVPSTASSTAFGVGPEVVREHAEEVAPAVVGEGHVRVGDRGGLGPLRHRVVQAQQLRDHLAQPGRVAFGQPGREVERGPARRAAQPAPPQPIEEPAGRHGIGA